MAPARAGQRRLWLPVLAACAASGASAPPPSPGVHALAGADDALVLLQARAGAAPEEPLALAEPESAPASANASEEDNRTRVLIFLAVGNSSQTMDRVIRGVENAKRHSAVRTDVFMAHYDKNQRAWLHRNGSWYNESVAFFVNQAGFKFQIAKRVLPEHFRERRYDWVWLVDEDVEFGHTNITRMFETATASQTLVAQPALDENMWDRDREAWERRKPAVPKAPKASNAARPLGAHAMSAVQLEQEQLRSGCQPREAMCNHLISHENCTYRYSNLVEVMAPLLRQEALMRVFQNCSSCIHNNSVWGLDKVWCGWLSRQFDRSRNKTCAVLDQATVIHDNQRTLGKWFKNGTRDFKVINKDYWSALNDAKKAYPQDFVTDMGKTLACVPV